MAKEMMRFYVKRLGESCSVYHRMSHKFLDGADTVEEAAAIIEQLNDLDQETLWRSLLFDYGIRVPHRDVIAGIRKDHGWQDSEDSYTKAWSYGTKDFYEMYPDLLVEEVIPFDLIQRVHDEKVDKEREEEKARQDAIKQAAEEYRRRDEVKIERVEKRDMGNGVKQLVVRIAAFKINLENVFE